MFSVKKILLVAFIIVLIIAIPVTIYLVSLQQKPKSSSIPATSLAFSPQNQSAKIGEDLNFDVNINPGSNSVSLVKVLISYDATKLSAENGSFIPNGSSFPSIVSGPTYEPGKVSVTLSIGANSPPIDKETKVGSITFKTLASTDSSSTLLTFGNDTQVLSTGATDQFNQNVLSTTTPANVSIAASEAPLTPSPSTTQIQQATQSSDLSLTPTSSLPTPTGAIEQPTVTQAPNTTVIPTGGPACVSFTADRGLNGVVPFNVNFTLVATDAAATTTKATFNFGDGQTKDVSQAEGVSGFGANVLTSHVYGSPGTFIATGSITDANGNVSSTDNCSLTVVVSGSGTPIAPSPLPPSGPSNLITIGIFGTILVVIGAVLLIAL
ncbi:MAG TPA: hypothetical protein VES68_00345 [Candidatus Sulfotelmatobacter sp.]|nr:hypothetical protein [Candidatus Sulfotelmatobacter sp.]